MKLENMLKPELQDLLKNQNLIKENYVNVVDIKYKDNL